MSAAASTADGWYAGRGNGSAGWKGGPYTWEELVTYAREGRIASTDLVWHESLPEWIPAASVPGLFAAPTPPAAVVAQAPAPLAPVAAAAAPMPITAPVVPAPAAHAYAPAPAPAPARKGRAGLIAGIVAGVLALLLLLGGGGWWAYSSGLFGTSGPTLGIAKAKLPDPAKLIQTQAYGEVPANQFAVTMKEDSSRADAETIAAKLGGAIVGEVEYLALFQIEFPGATEADLMKALEVAKADTNVEYAFPNQQITIDATIKGVRVDPYNDPVYGNGNGDGYNAVGVTKAWSYIKGSGIELSEAHVGVLDEGLYAPGEGREGEFGGDVEIDYPDPASGPSLTQVNGADGNPNPAGSHGTAVATIIGADSGNGGASGIAGPLGKKLKMSMINLWSGQYGGYTTSTPDPNDPTKVVWRNGKSYIVGELVALKNQVESGATVINCSFTAVSQDPLSVAAHRKFFEKMKQDHPLVTFVVAAGNTYNPGSGSSMTPGGMALDNVITVGAIDNQGKQADYSTSAAADYEITLAAPGSDAVVGVGPDGTPIKQNGTSFSAPHVTAAIALLKSINPKLTAAQVKQILVSTARDGVQVGTPGEPGSTKNVIPAAVGGKVLSIDAAVLKVINDMRAKEKPPLPELTPEILEKMGVIDALAETGNPTEYAVTGIVEATGEDGTDVQISASGDGVAIGGSTTKRLTGAGEVNWDVTLSKDEGTILVKRLDNGAASLITIEKFDINGLWSGKFTITDVTITDQKAAEKEGCSAAILNAIKGRPLPATMDVTVDESGQGSSVLQIDASSLQGDGKSSAKPVGFGVNYTGGSIVFEPQGGGSGISGMTATVSRASANSLAMSGVMSGGGKGWTMKASVKLTKQITE